MNEVFLFVGSQRVSMLRCGLGSEGAPGGSTWLTPRPAKLKREDRRFSIPLMKLSAACAIAGHILYRACDVIAASAPRRFGRPDGPTADSILGALRAPCGEIPIPVCLRDGLSFWQYALCVPQPR